MTVRSSSKQIQTLLGHFYAVLFAIIVLKKYRPTYLSRLFRGGQLKTPVKLVCLKRGAEISFFPSHAKNTEVGLQLHFGWAHAHPGNRFK
jgi:hypothetical protein